jgi:hypothetical protein
MFDAKMSLDALTCMFAGLSGITLTVMAVRATSIIDAKVKAGTLSASDEQKWRKWFRPGCLVGALCGFSPHLDCFANESSIEPSCSKQPRHYASVPYWTAWPRRA